MYQPRFFWVAKYTDNTLFSQLKDDGTQNLFKDIQIDKLQSFHIIDGETEAGFIDVLEGVVGLKKVQMTFGKHDSNRLIYFRRERRFLTDDNEELFPQTIHVIGLQATLDGHNRKVMFGINDQTEEILILDN